MKIEQLRASRRPEADWEPFMRRLDYGIRWERGRRITSWAAAAALLLAAIGGLLLLPATARSRPSLRADIPSLSAPVFTPSAGMAVTVSGEVVLVIPEVHT